MAYTYLTAQGLERLRKELEKLKFVDRPAASRAIAEARDKGDLSENAEYDAARDAQGMLEMKIAQLENLIANAKIVDDSQVDISQIKLLNKVKLKNLATKATMEYTLVTENEADFKAGRLSVATPIAKALLGKKLGEVVEIAVPAGTMKLQVLDISI